MMPIRIYMLVVNFDFKNDQVQYYNVNVDFKVYEVLGDANDVGA